MFANTEPVLERDSLVLMTGVSGFIGSHVADKLLESGYRVRGLTRDAEMNGWLANLFQKKYGRGKFELISADLTQPLDNLLKGNLKLPNAGQWLTSN